MSLPTEQGTPWTPGAIVNSRGVNFALCSRNAEHVELCLFDEKGNEQRIPVRHRTEDTWHIQVNGIGPGQRYGYRVHGPWDPAAGHRFNPALLLMDPYARSLDRIPAVGQDQYDYLVDADGQLLPNAADNTADTAKCVVVDPAAQAAVPGRRTPWHETIIYELHVKGFTRLNEALETGLRGRYAGLGDESVVSYLRALGITTVELMPVQEFVDEPFLTQRGLSNYWGYNPINYFCPSLRYARDNPAAEFRSMVDQLHEANIEVILDVVYNHTAEAGRLGPTFSFRGIDNATYYRLQAGNPELYVNDSGCGNALDTADPIVLRLVTDSLRYWVQEMGVDGFRFDLATTLGRTNQGYSADAPLFHAIKQDPVLSRAKLIVEPWDMGMDGYRLGQFPGGFSEWNDQYRDTVRRFWRGDTGMLPELARQVHGASDLFEARGRPPQASIAFITSHDGFSLADLVSFEEKHNEANQENNADGHDHNFSFNCGVEGPTEDADVLRLRHKQARNLILTLLLSQPVPMLLAGDELLRSKDGNNNSYCQDNKLNYLDWSKLGDPDVRDFNTFVARAIALRKSLPETHAERFIHGKQYAGYEGLDEIDWYHPRGRRMIEADWQDPSLATVGLRLHGAEIFKGLERRTNLILVYFNANSSPVPVRMPGQPVSGSWRLIMTSAANTNDMPVRVAPARTLRLEEFSVSVLLFNEELAI